MYAAGYRCSPLSAPRHQPVVWRGAARLALVVVFCSLVSVGLARVVMGGTQPAYSTVTVAPGDTLWGIASRQYPNDDVRMRVDEIMRLNGLSSPVIEAGEALKLPAQ